MGLLTTLTVAAAALLRGTPNQICYDKVGCFKNSSPWASLTRPIPLPQAPEDICTEVFYYNQRQKNLTIDVYPNITSDLNRIYNPRLKTYILCHGFATSGYHFADMAEAILENHNANIFIINWGKSAQQLDYPQAVSDIRVGAAVAKRLVDRLTSLGGQLSNFHLIGHSLGAHFLAYLGKRMKGKIGRLTGLDPAGPGFGGQPKRIRFSSKDAQFTEALHTNIGQNGIWEAVADVDYYFNSGLLQPGCLTLSSFLPSLDSIIPLVDTLVCAHTFSYDFYKESIKNPKCFTGRPFSGIHWAAGVLNTFDLGAGIGRSLLSNCDTTECVRLGIDGPETEYRGSVIVNTGRQPPYCQN